MSACPGASARILELGVARADVDSALGTAQVSMWSLALRASLRLYRGRAWLDAGAGGRVGLARMAGVPFDPAAARGGTVAGTWGGPLAYVGVGVESGGSWSRPASKAARCCATSRARWTTGRPSRSRDAGSRARSGSDGADDGCEGSGRGPHRRRRPGLRPEHGQDSRTDRGGTPPSSNIRTDIFLLRAVSSCAVGPPCASSNPDECFVITDAAGGRTSFDPDAVQFVPPGRSRHDGQRAGAVFPPDDRRRGGRFRCAT